MNPYLLKELRQLTRSRIVGGGLLVLLFGQYAVATLATIGFAELFASDSGAPPLGAAVFAAVTGVRDVAVCLALPLFVFGRFVADVPHDRTSLELAAAARPSAVVDGKVGAGLLLGASVSFGTLPFQALAVASNRRQTPAFRWVSYLFFTFFVGQYFVGFSAAWSVARAMGAAPTPFPPGLPPALGALLAVAAVATLGLALRAAAARALAPPSSDRDRTPRLTFLALWAAWGAAAAATALVRRDALFVFAWALVGGLGAFFHLVQAAASPPGLPRRALAARPANPLRRRLLFPLATGFPSGALFAFALLAAAAAVCLAETAAGRFSPPVDAIAARVAAAALYLVSVPLLLRGVLRSAAPRALRFLPPLSFFSVLLAQLFPALFSIGAREPLWGFPFFLPGVFACDTNVVGAHAVFAFLAFLVALGLNLEEILDARRAWLAPPPPRL